MRLISTLKTTAAVLAVATGFTAIGGPLYLAVTVVLNLAFLKGAVDIWRRPEETAIADDYRVEKKFFRLSLWYLFAHFGAILAEAALRPFGMGGW